MEKKFISGIFQFLILLFIVVSGLVIIGFLVLRSEPKQVYNSPVISDDEDNLTKESQLNQELNSGNEEKVVNNDNQAEEEKIINNDNQVEEEKVENLEPETKQESPEELNDSNKPIDPIKDDRKININNLF